MLEHMKKSILYPKNSMDLYHLEVVCLTSLYVGNTCAWIRSFLKDRSQKVRVDDAYSSFAKIKSGIPQGSVLGPILIIIFNNDMPDIIESTCQLFADDAKVFCKVSTKYDSMQLQDDLTRLSEWSKLWKLPFNIVKCKSLHIGRNNNRTIYKMNNQELKQGKRKT